MSQVSGRLQPKAAMATVAMATVTNELSTMIRISFFIADCLRRDWMGLKYLGPQLNRP